MLSLPPEMRAMTFRGFGGGAMVAGWFLVYEGEGDGEIFGGVEGWEDDKLMAGAGAGRHSFSVLGDNRSGFTQAILLHIKCR